MNKTNVLSNSYYIWWKNIDKVVLTLIAILIFLGIFFSLVSTSLIASTKLGTNSYYFFFKTFDFYFNGNYVNSILFNYK